MPAPGLLDVLDSWCDLRALGRLILRPVRSTVVLDARPHASAWAIGVTPSAIRATLGQRPSVFGYPTRASSAFGPSPVMAGAGGEGALCLSLTRDRQYPELLQQAQVI